MTKKSATSLAVIVVLNLSPATLLAQAAPPAKVHNKPTAPVARMQAAHVKPCWEVAGISKSAIAERRRIEQETRSQVQSVCNVLSQCPPVMPNGGPETCIRGPITSPASMASRRATSA